jgi:MFS family permease
MLGFLFGYDIGATSYVVSYFATIPSTPSASNSLSLMDAPFKTGWIVSSSSFGALLGTVILMYIDNSDNNEDSNNEDNNEDNHRENGLNGGNIRKVWLLLTTNIRPRPIGRRTELRYAGIFYFIGGLFEFLSSFSSYCSSSVLSNNLLLPIIILSIGRWIYGIGIGFAMHGGPTYLAEISPSTIRGQLVGGKEIAIVIGILIGYIIGYKFCGVIVIDNVNTNTGNSDNNNGSNSNNSWAYVYAVTLFGSILMIGLSYIIPESPRWLVSQQRSKSSSVDDDETETEKERNIISNDEVLQSLQFVWKPIQAKKEYDILMKIRKETKHTNNSNNDKESSSSKVSSLSLSLLNIKYRPALMVGLGLVILQQITGQPSVLSYAAPILSKVPGLSSSSSIVLAIFKVFVTSISVMLVETRGRKTLLLTGCFLMMVSLFILTFAFQEQDEQVQEQETNNDVDTTSQSQPQPQLDIRSYFVLIGMFAYIAGYQIGK